MESSAINQVVESRFEQQFQNEWEKINKNDNDSQNPSNGFDEE
jgi:hypothetical protein